MNGLALIAARAAKQRQVVLRDIPNPRNDPLDQYLPPLSKMRLSIFCRDTE